ncbi:GalE UDP-glucose 4-epimerase [Candidatus Methylopumilus universalis]|uniref:UDP-glucose 4-epimerase GalE n=1 Tax=Candidatus Methylopumilus universalis TaxID=2588536 RepID=UPI003BEEB34C
MNILVTGGAGYIGSHVVTVLSEAGHNVVIYDNLSNSQSDISQRLYQVTGKNISIVVGDVRDRFGIVDALKSFSIDAVLHLAGLKSVADSVSNPLAYYDNNLYGAISLVTAMNEVGCKLLIFSSSATVYGLPKYLPYDEEHPTHPINPYGCSKLTVERILSDLVKSDPEWSVASLRYFNPVGSHFSSIIGEHPKGYPNNLMPYIVQVASGQRKYLNVFGNDYSTIDGSGVRDYIHVMDLVEGHEAALNYILCHKGLNIFNLGTGKGVSVFDMIRAFESATSKSVPYKIIPRRVGDIAAFYADSTKAGRELGWYAKRDLSEMCLSSWNFFKNIN